MIKLVALLLAIVLYGQLGYGAANHYFHINNPSWPVWILLYALAGFIAITKCKGIVIDINDFLIFLFFSYVIINFIAIGESGNNEFAFKMATICIAPYLCGRILGRYVGLTLFNSLKLIFIIYMILIGVEILKDPQLTLGSQRLVLYNENYYSNNSNGGDGTLFSIGLTVGSMWVAVFAIMIMPKDKMRSNSFSLQGRGHFILKSRRRLLLAIISIPLIILAIGSRSSIITMLISSIMLMFIISRITKRNGTGWKTLLILIFAIGGLIFSYGFLPDSKKILLNEFVYVIEYLGQGMDSDTCNLNGSLMTRITMLRETVRLFGEFPIFGVGASNFGLYYCGEKDFFASPHSTVAHIIAELGILGVLLFSLLILSILYTFCRRMKAYNHNDHLNLWIIFSLWLFIFIQLQFTGNLFIDYHFYLLTGLLVSSLHPIQLSYFSKPIMPLSVAGSGGNGNNTAHLV